MRDNKAQYSFLFKIVLDHYFYFSSLTSRTRYTDLCSPQTPILDLVPDLESLYNGSRLLSLYRHLEECLVPIRVKLLPFGVEL